MILLPSRRASHKARKPRATIRRTSRCNRLSSKLQTPPMEKVTSRLATVARLQGLSPDERGSFHSVAQLFNPPVPLSPLLTRTKTLFLSLAAGGVFHSTPVEDAQPVVALSRVAFTAATAATSATTATSATMRQSSKDNAKHTVDRRR